MLRLRRQTMTNSTTTHKIPATTLMRVTLAMSFLRVSSNAVLEFLRCSYWLSAHYWLHLREEKKHCRAQNDYHQGRKDEKDQSGNHFHANLCSHLLRPLTALSSQIIGMNPQRLSNAGAKPLGLNQHGHQCLDVFQARSATQLAQGFDARLTDSHLQIHKLKFVAELGMRNPQFLGYAHQCLIEAKASLDADHQ